MDGYKIAISGLRSTVVIQLFVANVYRLFFGQFRVGLYLETD